jgi:hypothetical protein
MIKLYNIAIVVNKKEIFKKCNHNAILNLNNITNEIVNSNI